MGLAAAFVQSSLTVGLTSAVPLMVFFLVGPVLQKSNNQAIFLSGLVSLAVGSLLGDVFFHLVPEIFHLKGHYLRNCSLMLLGIFIFFVGERVLQHYHHGHGHDGGDRLRITTVEVGGMEEGNRPFRNGSGSTLSRVLGISEEEEEEELELGTLAGAHHHHQTSISGVAVSSSPPYNACPAEDGGSSGGHRHGIVRGTKPMGLLVLTSDFIHNFVDGLAIGISFGTSISVGLSTAVAVFLHEIPHELGDFAILLAAGYTPMAIVICNILTTLSSFVGIVLAICLIYCNQGDGPLGAALAPLSESIQPAILSLTAGNFLYIALADLIPELLHSHVGPDAGRRRRMAESLLQYGGVLVGAACMLLIKVVSD